MLNHRVVSDLDGMGHKQDDFTQYEFINLLSENIFESGYSRILLFGNGVFREHMRF